MKKLGSLTVHTLLREKIESKLVYFSLQVFHTRGHHRPPAIAIRYPRHVWQFDSHSISKARAIRPYVDFQFRKWTEKWSPFAFPPQQKSHRRAKRGSVTALLSVAASAGGLARGETMSKRWIPHKYQSEQSGIQIIGSSFYQSTPCSINRTVRCILRAAHTSIYSCLKVQQPLSETEDLTGGGLPFYTLSGSFQGSFRPIRGRLGRLETWPVS